MPDREPTIRSRELGEGLRQALKHAGISGSEAAYQLGLSATLISRLLSGQRNATVAQVAGLLAMCRVTGAERDRLLELCDDQHVPSWFQQHGSRLPQQLVTYINHENKAVTISYFQAMIVPGILQISDYARAVISRIANVPADEVDDRVAARLARQSLFSQDRPARFKFYLHEFVLHLPVGETTVMFDQLQHLLRMAGHPSVTLRVVPATFGAHASTAGSFTLMEFVEFKPVAYVESETSSLFMETPAEIEAYQRTLAALADAALDEGESMELIATLATELDSEREDHDEHP